MEIVATLQSAHNILRERLLRAAGVSTSTKKWWQEFLPKKTFLTLEQVEAEVKIVWCRRFIRLMRNRFMMGYLRYGPKKPDTPKYDYVKAIKTKLALYEESGNTENLVDIGNYAMLEFKFGEHPTKHFYAGDDTTHAELK